MATQQKFEVIQVTSREVACNGGGGALGHPKVFLHIDRDKDNTVVCPYCSRTYAYLESAAGAA